MPSFDEDDFEVRHIQAEFATGTNKVVEPLEVVSNEVLVDSFVVDRDRGGVRILDELVEKLARVND